MSSDGHTQRLATSSVEGGQDLSRVRRALTGDVEALAWIEQKLARIPSMVRAKHARLGGPLPADIVDDVIQNTVTSVWKKLDTFRGESALSCWCFGFVGHELFRAIHRWSADRSRRVEVESLTESLADESPSSLDELLEYDLIHFALRQLEEDEASIVRAKVFDDWTFQRIATEWRLPLGTAKTRYYHALDLLRARLSPVLRGKV